MSVSLELIKQLRAETSASIADCRKALDNSEGDIARAREILKKKGLEMAAKKADRVTSQGCVGSYLHHDHKTAVLVEVNCETDFVARNDDFRRFVKDLSLHIAASNPRYVKREDVPESDLKDAGDKEDFFKAHCLVEQPFVKDPALTIKDYLGTVIGKLGENIVIRRFVRYKVGE